MVMPLSTMVATPAIDMRERLRADQPPCRAVTGPREGEQEAGDAADPDRRAELVHGA